MAATLMKNMKRKREPSSVTTMHHSSSTFCDAIMENKKKSILTHIQIPGTKALVSKLEREKQGV
jgi:hypothetical protein